MEFKERLKALRKQKGITQSDLANILNYGYTAVSNYESGRNEPSIKDLKKIAEFFDVSLDYLLCVNDIKNPYVVSNGNEPDEEFLQNYSCLSPEGKNQLSSLLNWMVTQHPELISNSRPVLEAAQKHESYEAPSAETNK